MRDIITDEQRRERKNLAAIFIPYLLDAALEHTFAQVSKRLAPQQGVFCGLKPLLFTDFLQ